MTRFSGKRGVLAALIAGMAITASGFSHVGISYNYVPVGGERLSITERDVAASNEKIKMAAGALAAMWSADFGKLGTRFAVPGFVRYRGAVMSPCGVMRPNNAGYCR